MSINVKPLADRVIIDPAPAEEKTAGGIITQIQQKKNLKQGLLLLKRKKMNP